MRLARYLFIFILLFVVVTPVESSSGGLFDKINNFLWGRDYGRDHVEKGNEFYQKGEYDSAREEFEKAQKLLPEESSIYHSLALTNDKLGRFDKSLAYLKLADSKSKDGNELALSSTIRGTVYYSLASKEKDPKKSYVYSYMAYQEKLNALKIIRPQNEKEKRDKEILLRNLDIVYNSLQKIRAFLPSSKSGPKGKTKTMSIGVGASKFEKKCRAFTFSKKDKEKLENNQLIFLARSMQSDDPFGLDDTLLISPPDCLSEDRSRKQGNWLDLIENTAYRYFNEFKLRGKSLSKIEHLKKVEALLKEIERHSSRLRPKTAEALQLSSSFVQTLYLRGQIERSIGKEFIGPDPLKAKKFLEKALSKSIKPLHALSKLKFKIARAAELDSLELLAKEFPETTANLLNGIGYKRKGQPEDKAETLNDFQSRFLKSGNAFFGANESKIAAAEILYGLVPDDESFNWENNGRRHFEKLGHILFNFSLDINKQVESDCADLAGLFKKVIKVPKVNFGELVFEKMAKMDTPSEQEYFELSSYRIDHNAVAYTDEVLKSNDEQKMNSSGWKEKNRKLRNLSSNLKGIQADIRKSMNSLLVREGRERAKSRSQEEILKSVLGKLSVDNLKTDFDYQKNIGKELIKLLRPELANSRKNYLIELENKLTEGKADVDFLWDHAQKKNINPSSILESDNIKGDSEAYIYGLGKVVEDKALEEVDLIRKILSNGLKVSTSISRKTDYWENINKLLEELNRPIENKKEVEYLKDRLSLYLQELINPAVKDNLLSEKMSIFDEEDSKRLSSLVPEDLFGNLFGEGSKQRGQKLSDEITAGKKAEKGSAKGEDVVFGKYSSNHYILFTEGLGLKVENNRRVYQDSLAPKDPPLGRINDPHDILTLRTTLLGDGSLLAPQNSVLKSAKLTNGMDITRKAIRGYSKNGRSLKISEHPGEEVIVEFYMNASSTKEDIGRSQKGIEDYYLNNSSDKLDLSLAPELKQLVESLKKQLYDPKPLSKEEVQEIAVRELIKWIDTNIYYDSGEKSFEVYSRFKKIAKKDKKAFVLNHLLKENVGDCDVHNGLLVHILNNELGIPARLPVGFAGKGGQIKLKSGHGWSEAWLPNRGGWVTFDATSSNEFSKKGATQDLLTKEKKPLDFFKKRAGVSKSSNMRSALDCILRKLRQEIKLEGLILGINSLIDKNETPPCGVKKMDISYNRKSPSLWSIFNGLKYGVKREIKDRDEVDKFSLEINKIIFSMIAEYEGDTKRKVEGDSGTLGEIFGSFVDVRSYLFDEEYIDLYFKALKILRPKRFEFKDHFHVGPALKLDRAFNLRDIDSESGKITSKIVAYFKEKNFQHMAEELREISIDSKKGRTFGVSFYSSRLDRVNQLRERRRQFFSTQDFDEERKSQIEEMAERTILDLYRSYQKNAELSNKEREQLLAKTFPDKGRIDGHNRSLSDHYHGEKTYKKLKRIYFRDNTKGLLEKLRRGEAIPDFVESLILDMDKPSRVALFDSIIASPDVQIKLVKNEKIDFRRVQVVQSLVGDFSAEEVLAIIDGLDSLPEVQAEKISELRGALSVHLMANFVLSSEERSKALSAPDLKFGRAKIFNSEDKSYWHGKNAQKYLSEHLDRGINRDVQEFYVADFSQLSKEVFNIQEEENLGAKIYTDDLIWDELLKIKNEKSFKDQLKALLKSRRLSVEPSTISRSLRNNENPHLKKYTPLIIKELFEGDEYELEKALDEFISGNEEISNKSLFLDILNLATLSDQKELEKISDIVPYDKLLLVLKPSGEIAKQIGLSKVLDSIINSKSRLQIKLKSDGIKAVEKLTPKLSKLYDQTLGLLSDTESIDDTYYDLLWWSRVESKKYVETEKGAQPKDLKTILSLVKNNIDNGGNPYKAITFQSSTGEVESIDVEEMLDLSLKEWSSYISESNYDRDFLNNLETILSLTNKLDKNSASAWFSKLKPYLKIMFKVAPENVQIGIPQRLNKYLYSIENLKEFDSFATDYINSFVKGARPVSSEIMMRSLMAQEKAMKRKRNYAFIFKLAMSDNAFPKLERRTAGEKLEITQLEFALMQSFSSLLDNHKINELVREEQLGRDRERRKIPTILSPVLKAKKNIELFNESLQSQALLDASLMRVGGADKTDTPYTYTGPFQLENKDKVYVLAQGVGHGLISPLIFSQLALDGEIDLSKLSKSEVQKVKDNLLLGIAKQTIIRSLGETFINKDSGKEHRAYVGPAFFDGLSQRDKVKFVKSGGLPMDQKLFVQVQALMNKKGIDLEPYYSKFRLKKIKSVDDL